ncbi:MAG: branched-chain amino acid ABC transporter permease [Chloroflexi bacterium]|nr:MAG: branched-chain amino acid ABC transporter permease [Chloroflexota bacterium]
MTVINRTIYASIRKIESPTLRGAADMLARLVLENWFYLLFVLFLLRFPYIIADLTDTEVMPRRPTGDSAFWQSEMARALTLSCLAMSYNLLFGFSGIISFGHALFFGAGGYVTFILMFQYDTSLQEKTLAAVVFVGLVLAVLRRLSWRGLVVYLVIGVGLVLVLLPRDGTISFYQAAAVAVLVSITLSLASGFVTLRLRGIYFAMFTLALAEMFWVLAKSGTLRDISGAEDGLGFSDVLPEVLNPTRTADGSRLEMYRWTVLFFVIVFLAIRRYLNSPAGRVIQAVRENEERARTIGYNTLLYKLLTMGFAGVIATLSGLLFVVWATDKRVHPEALSLKYTVDPLLNTLIGGIGTLTGPVVATLGLNLGEVYLRNETFMLDTQIFGVLAVWQLAALIVAAILLAAIRPTLQTVAERAIRRYRPETPFEPGTPDYQRIMLAFSTAGFVVLTIIGLIIGSGMQRDLQDEVYHISDLWELFLGALFVIVVMALPHGIVGTWNRYWAARRVRRLEQALHSEKKSAV